MLDSIDNAIVTALTRDVRVLTVPQIGRHKWCGTAPLGIESATKRVFRLAEHDLVHVESIIARPEIELESPVIRWMPGSRKKPHFGSAAYQLKRRWHEIPEPIVVVRATEAAAKRFGGYNKGYHPRADERTHDIHVGALWSRYTSRLLRGDTEWIGEGRLRTERCSEIYHDRIPDAVLRTPNKETPELIVEFGGAYAKSKLIDMHSAFADYPYVVW